MIKSRSARLPIVVLLAALAAALSLPGRALAAGTTPGAPTIRSVSPGDTTLRVTLRAPTDNGGSAVLGYVVTAVAGSQSVSTNTSSTTATVSGLTDGVAYSVTAKALNANGLGPASAAVKGTPVAGPVSLTLVADHPTFVKQGTRVTYSGTVTRSAAPVGGAQVFVTETYLDGKLVTLGTTTTDSVGHYAFATTPLYNGSISISALTAKASVPSRVLVSLTAPRVTSQHGRSITVVASSAPGFVTGTGRVERAQLQLVSAAGHVEKVLATAAAAQRVSRHGYAHGVNDITFRVVLPHTGVSKLVVKVLGTPVNTGASSGSTTVHATN